MHAVLVESDPFCTMLDLQLTFYVPVCNKNKAHCPFLQYLRTTSAILAGAQSYFVRERMVAMTQYPTLIISLMYSYQDSTCSCSEEVCVFYKFHLNIHIVHTVPSNSDLSSKPQALVALLPDQIQLCTDYFSFS